MNEIYKQLLTL